MRTAIFMGLNLVALAIMQTVGIHEIQVSETTTKFISIMFAAFVFMDIIDFI